MQTYKFDLFSYVDTDIVLPENTVFFRGINISTKNVIQDRPIYLSALDIAKQYGKNVYGIKTTKSLTLIDIRKLRHFLRLIISSRKFESQDISKCIYYLTIAFGLCSYMKQVELLENYVQMISKDVVDENELNFVVSRIKYMKNYDVNKLPLNPWDPEGVRVAETYIDNYVMLILKELFSGIYDGIIAPRMISPFHVSDKTHEEIIIFDPIKSELEICDQTEVKSMNINVLFNDGKSIQTFKYKDMFARSIYVGGSICVDRDKFYKNKKLVRDAKRLAKKFAASFELDRHMTKPTLYTGCI